MKFYGNGTVWDAEKERVLCEFNKDGELITNDTRTIKILTELNYQNDGTNNLIEEIKEEEKEEEEKVVTTGRRRGVQIADTE